MGRKHLKWRLDWNVYFWCYSLKFFAGSFKYVPTTLNLNTNSSSSYDTPESLKYILACAWLRIVHSLVMLVTQKTIEYNFNRWILDVFAPYFVCVIVFYETAFLQCMARCLLNFFFSSSTISQGYTYSLYFSFSKIIVLVHWWGFSLPKKIYCNIAHIERLIANSSYNGCT